MSGLVLSEEEREAVREAVKWARWYLAGSLVAAHPKSRAAVAVLDRLIAAHPKSRAAVDVLDRLIAAPQAAPEAPDWHERTTGHYVLEVKRGTWETCLASVYPVGNLWAWDAAGLHGNAKTVDEAKALAVQAVREWADLSLAATGRPATPPLTTAT